VGSTAAFALQCSGVVSHLCLVDAQRDLAGGQVLDLVNGAALTSGARVSVGTLADAADSHVIVITAGSRRQPHESRLDLIHRNVALVRGLVKEIAQQKLRSDACLLMVSNPVDVLTHLAVEEAGLPWQRVIGLGTLLDTARLRGALAQRLKVPATQVAVLVLGEHGDSMVPIWSTATVAGLGIEQWPGVTPQLLREVFEETKSAGAQLIKLKGGSGFAVGLAIREVIHTLLLDERKVLPVATLQQGKYELRNICLSVPTVLGCGGVREQVEVPLTPKEKLGLQQSARVLRQTLDQVRTGP
jgi:L-lactate dehydrogenase